MGDFLAVGRLVLDLYNACKDAPGEFQEICRELSSIHTVLSGLATQAQDPTSLLINQGKERIPEWMKIQENLEFTLGELQDLVKRYDGAKRLAKNSVCLGKSGTIEGKVEFSPKCYQCIRRKFEPFGTGKNGAGLGEDRSDAQRVCEGRKKRRQGTHSAQCLREQRCDILGKG